MLNEVTNGLHSLSAIVFLLILFFPFFIRRHLVRSPEKLAYSLKRWKQLFLIAHIFLIISLLTGIEMAYRADSSFQWVTSLWFISVLIVFLLLGALLGIVMKYTRIAITSSGSGDSHNTVHIKLQKFSWLLSSSILVILVLMFISPFGH
ncbi:hypothetical protein [Bacillus fonticola]|uniref:hypothetical protein n=1 Tax=Bacillus fonticola TaxID=2728853 RepID=UPI001475B03A|nr:hypothetical protein [Bacillus fonticola]